MQQRNTIGPPAVLQTAHALACARRSGSGSRAIRNPASTPLKGREYGAALIVALLLTALGAAVAAQLIQPLAGWLQREYLARDVQASYTLADAAASWSLTVLSGDARTSTIDHYGELWAIPLPATQVEGGTIEGRITDLQAKFNLNSVADSAGNRSEPNVQVCKAVFARAGVPLALAERLADAIDRDAIAATGQSESQAHGATLRNARIASLSDLISLGGFTESHLVALAPWVDVLPEPTPINVNTASPEMLAAALPNASADQWSRALAARQTKPFANVNELAVALGVPVAESAFSVSAHYFETIAQIKFDYVSHKITTRTQRKLGAWPLVYYRTVQNA
jgi:general secretion pathway protein K